jgi:hypothetical protein
LNALNRIRRAGFISVSGAGSTVVMHISLRGSLVEMFIRGYHSTQSTVGLAIASTNLLVQSPTYSFSAAIENVLCLI